MAAIAQLAGARPIAGARASAPLAGAPFRAGAALAARPARRRAAAAGRRPPAVVAAAAYICVDCGYIYDGSEGPFEKLPSSYKCPACSAPKRRFQPYAGGRGKNDQKSMQARMKALKGGGGGSAAAADSGPSPAVLVGAGAVFLAALYFGLNSQF